MTTTRERRPDGRQLPPRVFDVTIAAAGLIVLAVPFAVIAAIIRWTSHGPAFFRQERVGLGGRSFTVIKFRSMVVDAGTRGGQLTIGSRDPRVTRVGAVLRALKLDELPQLWNVVRGDMRLVGPRPEVRAYVRRYNEEQRSVLSVRPGITDPASLAFRQEDDLLAGTDDPEHVYVTTIMPRKLAINLDYLRRRTLATDVRVLIETVWYAVIRGRRSTDVVPG